MTHPSTRNSPLPISGPARPAGRTRAFTLVELLVVMAIIATLLGILLPGLAGAREQARKLKCLTNLKGLGTGFSLYYDANDETLPYVLPLQDRPPPGRENDPLLLDILEAYIDAPIPRKDAGETYFTNVAYPWRCPSDIIGTDEETEFQPVWATSGTSYYYLPGALMLFFELSGQVERDKVAKHVTLIYEQGNNSGPVLEDADKWHDPKARGDKGKNALYFNDWRAEPKEQ